MSRSKKRAAVLFEAMSKAPTSQSTVRRGGFSWHRRDDDDNAAPILVAEPLTEEEAAVELASEQAALAEEQARREEEAREREVRKSVRREARDAKKAERAARRAEKRAARISRSGQSGSGHDPATNLARGRIVFSPGPVVTLSGIAILCGLMLGAYALGRRSAGPTGDLETISGVTPPDHSKSPLLPSENQARSDDARRSSRPVDPELSRLLQPPASLSDSRSSEPQPSRTVANMPAAASDSESLNYLQIESFLVSRYHPDSEVQEHLKDVRKFLAERNVQTVARRRSSGYVLFSRLGFPTGSEYENQRRQFKSRIEKLGQAYSQAGGRYSFRGCLFVNHAEAQRGPLF